MLRCALLALSLTALAVPATAQVLRQFPATALRGELLVTLPPEVTLNRQPARLAPGARIRGMDNMLLTSGAALGQRLLVNYTLDLQGQMLDVWILNPAEAARRPWPRSPQEAAAWQFNPDQQTWSRP